MAIVTMSSSPALSRSVPPVAVAAAACTWLLLLLVSPYLVSHLLPSDLLFRLAGGVYLVGRLVCHQSAERSFHSWGVQLPVCGRCFGLYAAAATGSTAAALAIVANRVRGVRPIDARADCPRHAATLGLGGERGWRLRLVGSAIPTVLSVGLELVGVWRQSPAIRAVAALPLGLVVGWFVTAHAFEVRTRLAPRPYCR